jgi:hypothetical protein
MALLDFIKNRKQQPSTEQTQNQKPETAKQMYAREAAQDRANQKPEPQIADAEKVKAKELGARIDAVAQETQQKVPAQTPAPESGASSPEPQRQMMTAQDKVAPSLSPTTAQAGTPAAEQEKNALAKGSPAQSQQKSQEPPKPTIARRPPSWER